MGALLSRAIWAMLAGALGALVGDVVGRSVGQPGIGAPLGAAFFAALAAAVEGWRARRLLNWLRGDQTRGAPRDTGFWGELGYRVERGFRQRETQIERERQRLEQFLSAIEASPNGVMMLDASGQIEWCNSEAADHFGLDPVRDRRQRVTNLVRQPAFVQFLQVGDFSQPLMLVDPLGRRSFSVIVREYGEGLRLVLSLDVTERERADAMRRDFVANVSHEIRTPLTVLAGFVETMASLPLTPVERERVLKLMEQQTNRMQALVADLLTLAQLEGSPRPPPDRWWPVATLLRRAEADGRALSAGRHEISAAGGEDCEIAGSDTELLSAIGNLVGNAVRYTPEGGRIDLRFRTRDDGSAEIEVADTGVGIAREHLPRLTERFYRVDSSRSRETGGTGLGLSIVKHVVQRHGGEIDVASEPGRGSRFRLVFPAARLRQRAAASGASTAAAGAA
ncbi:phosphate regulon sensor histidine kinase PhoR [Rubrivivax gelatinosus]|uniref:Phosphate regulon sensor protein PhoR n=1 Tax=Rubrivivax gelatinosus (strain NBRC 100245 / IL144) TaxID=983917 RepID=I0HUG5_RUBGI|nr:phosphate regulon sensor histidine kinase PhoR [Rubrivivax gelatinosus]BAL96652.1 phosphate regulon sensor protein PhoR [Rubrivivax gelatinosus IL144]